MDWLPWAISGATSLAGGLLGGKGGGGGSAEPKAFYEQLPDYSEATGARETWWDKLQMWGEQPGYGAIAQPWEDIWGRTKKKVSQYFWGDETGGGLAGKVRASAARRGVSESPALETELTRMGQMESSQLSDLAVEQALQEATFGEQGRQNWMNQLMTLAQIKPQYMTTWQTTQPQQPTTGGIGRAISGIGGAMSDYFLQQQQMDWYSSMLDKFLQ